MGVEQDFSYIIETTDILETRIRTLIVLSGVVLIGVLLSSFTNVGQFITSQTGVTELHSYAPGPGDLFITAALGGLFFISLPLELIFSAAVINGTPQWQLIAGIVAGFVLGSLGSYFIGLRLSNVFLRIVSPKKLYGMRRWVGRYGSYAVFIVNVLPLPGPLLTFALGVSRYNITRLFTLLIVANLVKYTAIFSVIVYVLT